MPFTSRTEIRILLIEDSEHDFWAFRRAFKNQRSPVRITHYVRAEDALERLRIDSRSFDLIVTNHKLPGMSGLDLCRELIKKQISLPLILLLSVGDENLALEAIKAGVDDYLIKDPDHGYLDLWPVLFSDIIQKHGFRLAGKAAEEAQRLKTAPYPEISEDQSEFVCRFLFEKHISYVNDAFCRYFGKEQCELMGFHFLELFPDEEHPRIEALISSLTRGNPTGTIAHHVMASNGNIRWQQWVYRAIFDSNGGLPEYQLVGHDITAEKRGEESLRLSEDRYHGLIESILSGFFICELDSGDFIHINQRACDLVEYSMQEALRGSIWDLIEPDDHQPFKEQIQGLLDGNTRAAPSHTCTMLRKDGSLFDAEIGVAIVTLQGKRVLQGLFSEKPAPISDSRELEFAQKMEVIGTLAGGIAHQFNNALAAITGNVGLLEMDLTDDDRVKRYIEPIYESTRRMSNLTNQLLAYARGGKYNPKQISLSEFIEDTLPLIQLTMDSNTKVETDLSDDPFSVVVDVAQMQMTLSALIANAVEAVDGGGHITIMTRIEEIGEKYAKSHPGLKSGRYVRLIIEDDGTGMDDETRSKIFEPFYTTKFHGRGLSMAAVYGIVKNHDGWITVDSELGKGTAVHILLPAIPVEVREREKPAVGLHRGKGLILVIEDEEIVMNVTRTILERLGYDVLQAETGKEAIEIAKTYESPIDAAILDIVLPDMSGKQVYAELMKSRPDLGVIVCSRYAIDGPAQEILDAGAQGFIQKPFSFSSLSEKLKDILEGRS